MFDGFLFALTLLAALGCWVIGGIFYAFSSFIMRGLTRLPSAQGIAAMQSINVAVLNRWFLAPFVGTAVACAALVVSSLARWHEPDSIFRLVGGGLYLLGTFLVTTAFNVPRNDALAAVDPDSAAGAAQWARYVPGWTAWSTVRTAAALAAAAALTIALVAGRAEQLVEALRAVAHTHIHLHATLRSMPGSDRGAEPRLRGHARRQLCAVALEGGLRGDAAERPVEAAPGEGSSARGGVRPDPVRGRGGDLGGPLSRERPPSPRGMA